MLRAAFLLCAAVALLAQSAPPQFEAASIRPSDRDELSAPSGCETTPGLVRCTNVTLKRAIVGAYDVVPDRVLGGPDWIDSDCYQITARTNQPLAGETLDAMLQALLAERFQLRLHRETRTREAFVLEVAKNGPKLHPAGDAARSYYNGHGHMEATSVSMSMFAGVLSRQLGLPVVDRTGLSGAFNFKLVWNPDSPLTLELGTSAASDAGVELFNAIQQQLGLVLRARRMAVEMLVIDHAEKPSDN
jgi:uncharacterized protein (TIGR03435 family)